MKRKMIRDLYVGRKLADGYPDLEKLGVDWFSRSQLSHSKVEEVMQSLERLIELSREPKGILVVGCGPNPHAINQLLSMGYDVSGVEPIAEYVNKAGDFLGDPKRVVLGSAEKLPLGDHSKRVIIMTSVLEHVDSPLQSLAEAYRVLMPGGVVYISTTNRWKLSLTGNNGEYRVRFFNWFPDIVKESYVYHHLHFNPSLANYTPRPAVHWFSYPDLCKLGRQAGFAQFYSLLDLVNDKSPYVSKSRLRKWLLKPMQNNVWLRSFALTQAGGTIFMLKRPA